MNEKTEIAPWFAIMLKEMDDTDQIIAVRGHFSHGCMHQKWEGKKKDVGKHMVKKKGWKSTYNNIITELRLEDKEHIRYYLRMNTETFELSAI